MKFSREGKRFILAAILIAVASLNTGNNLIYLILSMMLSIILLSGVVLKENMKGLRIGIFQGRPIFANTPADIDISISNKKKIPSYSLKVSLSEKSRVDAYFPEIPGLSRVAKTASVLYPKRGRYGRGGIFVASSFPFIFFSKRISAGTDEEIIVYPELKDTNGILPEALNEKYALSPENMGKGDALAMIREFRYSDDWRRIHWKASAKTGKLMVKEYAYEDPRKATVILDNLMPHDSELFEKSVSLAASVSDRFLKDGFFVRLLTCRKLIPFGSGSEHLFKILDVLAIIEGQDSWECPLSLDAESGGLVILILNSEHSRSNRFVPVSDMVVYASDL